LMQSPPVRSSRSLGCGTARNCAPSHEPIARASAAYLPEGPLVLPGGRRGEEARLDEAHADPRRHPGAVPQAGRHEGPRRGARPRADAGAGLAQGSLRRPQGHRERRMGRARHQRGLRGVPGARGDDTRPASAS
jgi:hypothetical protein